MARPGLGRWLLLATLVGCDAPGDDAILAPRQPVSNADVSEALLVPAAPASVTPRPGPYRARQAAAVEQNEDCVACHVEQAAQWSGSYHQRAFDNPAFQAALAIEPTPFCRGCHAPESNPAEAPTAAVAELGVGCVSCHVTADGTVLAASNDDREATLEASVAPHAIQYSTDFAHTGGCASCHEFGFPGLSGGNDAHFMQTTVREHARSPASAQACASCHMPLTEGGRRSHAFASVRDPEWLRSRLDVAAAVTEYQTTIVRLEQTDPGHGFPTGDLFRRLEVGAELRGPTGEVLARTVRHLARHFEVRPGSKGRVLIEDDRVFDDVREVELDLGCAGDDAEIYWWVTYQRVAQAFDGSKPANAEIESEVPLYSGKLCGQSRTP